jgi:hypothetical protein
VSQSTSDVCIVPLADCRDALTDILRQGARDMLAKAIQAEVADWIESRAHITDSTGRRQVVRVSSSRFVCRVVKLSAIWHDFFVRPIEPT